ncbi:unnamed protein product [Phyllotreta striolata]|uniref:C2H2-type domain-containing protein n=1 Tax=Phyllotreta striolata TaxID=444603 RepID=A0A9N9TDN1_PHYSR|nr:unnamed protein product [Phyllotreta striolata]
MNDNNYQMDNFSSYTQQAQYTKQPGRIETPQSYFSYSSALLNNFGSNSNYLDVCANPVPQNNSRNQGNSAGYQEQVDMFNWENRVIPDLEKVIKFPDKIEMIEISSKDLSPASYCSNMDLLMPELYKNQGKETLSCSRYDSQCYYNQGNCQRNFDYPSCVQYETPAKCCPQKTNDNETLMKSCNFTSDIFLENNDTSTKHSNFNKPYCENYIDYNMYNTYDKSQDPQLPIHNDFFNNTGNMQFDPIDQQTEDSNEDSDIIVEDSDEEISSCDVQEKKQQFTKLNKCLICNLSYTPFGIQFYFLTSKNPLTMSTQKPVVEKIIELVGNVCTRSYLCSECLGLLNTIDHLQLKLSTFNTEFVGKYQQTCQENNIEYNRVRRDNVKKVTRYKCKICKKVLCLRNYFQYHLKRHKTTKILCEHCGKIFTTRKKFLEHKKRCTKLPPPRKIEPYKCTNCSKIFRTNSQLKCHLNVCLGMLPFECKHHHCDKKFATKTQLKYHVKLKHDKKFVAICSICNIGFVKLAAYKNHKLTHTSEKKHSCNKCEKSYKTLSNLRFHMKVHDKLLPFNCPICEKGFLRKDYLDTHVNKHRNIKNYECNVCKKKFGSQKSLDAHSKYHEESKKVTCNICGKTMINGFKDHLRVHNNLKEFECEHCDHKFNTKGALNKHVKKKHFEKYNGD